MAEDEKEDKKKEKIITYEDYDDTCPDCGRDKEKCI